MLNRVLMPVAAALLLAALPFGSEPHLLQKWNLFRNGWLHKGEDWLDFALHGLPLVLALLYASVMLFKLKRQPQA